MIENNNSHPTREELRKAINNSLDKMDINGGAVFLVVEQKGEKHGIVVCGKGERLHTILSSAISNDKKLSQLFKLIMLVVEIQQGVVQNAKKKN